MRNNKFSSASDRRWQRRYERIQQRKEEEQRQQELYEQFDYDQLSKGMQQIRYVRGADISRFDISEPAVATAPTYTITIPEPEFDRPNRNGTVINRDVWDDALSEYFGITGAPGEEESARLRAVAHDYSELSRQIEKAWKDYIQSHAAELFDAFVDVKDIGLGDRAMFSIDTSLAADIQEAELDTGDTDILDSFLGEFLLQGA